MNVDGESMIDGFEPRRIPTDEADLVRTIECPVLVLWGEKAPMHRLYDVLATWQGRAANARGRPLACGHYLPEEAPDETGGELIRFFSG